MRMGIGASQFVYWQSDDKCTNLFDPRAFGLPGRPNAAVTWDANGFPTSLPTGVDSGWYIAATEGYTRPGRYRLAARGSGKVYYTHPDIPPAQQTFVVKASSPGASSILGEYDVKTTGRTMLMIRETDPADHLRDIRFSRVGNDPASTFTAEYTAELKNFAAIRLAGWPLVIASTEVDWPSDPDSLAGNVSRWRAGIELCNVLGRDPWINIPHMASDDYVRQLARLIKATLMPGLKVHIEYSIEVWNWGGPFSVATKWVQDWTAKNLGTTYSLQHGHAYLAAHVQDVFVAEAPDLPVVRMISNQHFNPEHFRQNCEMIDAKGLKFASGVDPIPATGLKFDAVATAPYADPMMAGLDWAVVDPLLSSGTDADRDAAIRLVFDAYDRTIPLLDAAIQPYKALADKHGMKIFAYECGPGWELSPSEPQRRLDLLQASYRDPRMRAFLSDKYFPWMSKYYDLAMYTQHTDRPSPGKFWGVRGTADETPCPKLDACLAWCSANNPSPTPIPVPTPVPPPTPTPVPPPTPTPTPTPTPVPVPPPTPVPTPVPPPTPVPTPVPPPVPMHDLIAAAADIGSRLAATDALFADLRAFVADEKGNPKQIMKEVVHRLDAIDAEIADLRTRSGKLVSDMESAGGQ